MTTIIELTNNWLNLTSNQSLVNGSSYTVQNLGSYQVFLYESSSLPSSTDDGLVLNQIDSALLKQGTDNIYIRSSRDSGRIVLNIAN
jgi:hypothetical protein